MARSGQYPSQQQMNGEFRRINWSCADSGGRIERLSRVTAPISGRSCAESAQCVIVRDRQDRPETRQALKQEVIQVDATQHQISSQRPLTAACDLRLVVETRPPAVRLRIPSKRWQPRRQYSSAMVIRVGRDIAPAFMLNAGVILDGSDGDFAVDVPASKI